MTRAHLRASLVALALALAACASGGTGSRSSGSADLLTEAQLSEYSSATAFQAIQRLRPQWLQPRRLSGSSPEPVVVYLDGVRIGGTDALHRVQASSLVQIRHRNGRDATTFHGTGHGGGTIELTTRGG